MAPPSPTQLAWRGRIEAVLRVVAPALDLLLAAGDRASRAVDRGEPDGALAATPYPSGALVRPRRRVGAGPITAAPSPRDER